jgi:signal peptidase II
VDQPSPGSGTAAGGQSGRAFQAPAAWVILLSILAAGLTIDLASKAWSFKVVADQPVVLERRLALDPDWAVPPHAGVSALPGRLLQMQLVINRGAVFGIGENQRFFFVLFTLAALSAGLLVFARFTTSRDHLAHLAIGMIMAGGIGNLHDRIAFGVVRDFLHMMPGYTLPFEWTWPGGSPELFPWVFNLADVMLLSGMAMLMMHLSRVDKRRKRAAAAVQRLEGLSA